MIVCSIGDWPNYPRPFEVPLGQPFTFPPGLPYTPPWESTPIYPRPASPFQPFPFTHPMPSAKPHKCPVCEGKGTVPAGFYQDNVCDQSCRSCSGTGVVWHS